MGESSDGSSAAARCAHQDEEESSEQGFFSRIIGAFSGSESDEDAPDETEERPKSSQHGILNLRRMRVDDVAIPKVEIVAVPDDIGRDELVEVFRESGMTRLPVYSGTLDTPVGMIHLKDFALTHGFNGSGAKSFSVTDTLRPLLYAPPSMPIGVLLQKMQSDRIHMALVIDEYGGVDGLVTIEDLIETVIGEIEDEHDLDEGLFWTLEKGGTYLAEARTPLEDFEPEIGVDLSEGFEDEEIDTLGGLVFVLVGRVPARGEMIHHPAGLDFEVVDADARRIKRLRVHPGPEMNA